MQASLFGFMGSSPERDSLLEAHAILCAEYRYPIPYFHEIEPLSELVSSLLSHRARNSDPGRAYQCLARAFGGEEGKGKSAPEAVWRRVMDAPVALARRWLEAIPGVGPKTSAAVLSFSSLHRRAPGRGFGA